MRSDLRNISTKRLFSLQAKRFDQYHNTLKHLKAKPVLKNKQATPIENLSFGEVIAIKQILNNPNIDGLLQVFKMVFKLNKNKVLNIPVLDFYHAFNWVQEQVLIINKRERSQLVSKLPIDSKLKDAGIKEFNELGEMKSLIEVGKMFGKSPESIAKWRYSIVFSILKDSRIANDVNVRYNKILSRK